MLAFKSIASRSAAGRSAAPLSSPVSKERIAVFRRCAHHESVISDEMDWETYRMFAFAARERVTPGPVAHNHSKYIADEVLELAASPSLIGDFSAASSPPAQGLSNLDMNSLEHELLGT